MNPTIPHPGSYEAKALSCLCPAASNCWGRGEVGSTPDAPTYTLHPHCRVHRPGYVPHPLDVEPRERPVIKRGTGLRLASMGHQPAHRQTIIGTCLECGREDVNLSHASPGLCITRLGRTGCGDKARRKAARDARRAA